MASPTFRSSRVASHRLPIDLVVEADKMNVAGERPLQIACHDATAAHARKQRPRTTCDRPSARAQNVWRAHQDSGVDTSTRPSEGWRPRAWIVDVEDGTREQSRPFTRDRRERATVEPREHGMFRRRRAAIHARMKFGRRRQTCGGNARTRTRSPQRTVGNLRLEDVKAFPLNLRRFAFGPA